MKKRPIQLLLLEDNPGDARLMTEYLREDETLLFEVHLVETLQAGLASLAKSTPEIILADLGLPDSQDLDTFLQLQAAASQVPIVVLTGLNDKHLAAQAVKAGAQDYLSKDEVNSSLLRRAIGYAIDRKQAIEALHQNEERFRLMFENTPVGYQSLDKDGCFLDVNKSWLDLLGYARQEVIGHSFADFLQPDQAALFRERFPVLTQSRQVIQDVEFILQRKDGSLLEASFTTRLARDEAGRFMRTHSAFQDITQRKQSERALLLMTDTQRQIAGLNSIKEVYDLLGSRVQALIGHGYVGVSHLDEPSQTLQLIGLYGLGSLYDRLMGKINFDPIHTSFPIKKMSIKDLELFRSGRLGLTDGGLYNLSLKKVPKRICVAIEKELKLTHFYSMGFIWDGSHHGGIAILAKGDLEPYREQIETTVNQATLALQRILSDEAMRRSESQYRLLAENIQDVIWIMDIKENRFVYVSPSVTRLRGYTPQEVLAVPVSESLTPESALAVTGWMSEVFQIPTDPNPSRTFLVEQPCKDGSTVWTEVSVNLIRDENDIPFQILGVSRDISSRRQAEQQIRLQAAALKSAANAMVITDRDGSIQWINPAYEQLTGYSLQEALGLNPRILNSGLQTPEFYKTLWDTILSGRVWHAELVNKRKDGSLYNEEETITPLLDESGVITHFIGVKQDISRRKQTEEDLFRSESELRALFAALPDVVLMFDEDGCYLKVAETNQDLLYRPLEELTGKTLHDVFPKSEADLFVKHISDVLVSKETVNFEYPLMIQGRENWFSATVAPMSENTVVWVARDITEKKINNLALQESNSLLQATLESTADGILAVDLQGRITMTNQNFAEMWGMPRQQLEGNDVSGSRTKIIDLLKDPQAFLKKTQTIYADPAAESFDVIELKDGRIIERVSRPQTYAGTIVGRVSSFRDVTERIRSEQAVRESEAKYRSLFDNVPDGVYQTTPDGRILAVNSALVSMLGFESADELKNANAYQMYEEKYGRDQFLEEINKNGIVKNLEVQLRTAQGKSLVGLENTRAFKDATGKVLYYEGTMTDISERKQVETERQVLMEIMQGLTFTDDLHAYLEVVHHAIGKVIHARNFFVALHNKETGLFDEPYYVDEYDQPGASYDMGKSLSAYVFRTRRPYLNDPESFNALIKQGEVELVGVDSGSWLGVPLIVSKDTIGVMVVQDYESQDVYSPHDVEFLSSIAGQVAQSIQRKESEQRLAQQKNEISRLYRASESLLVGTKQKLNDLANSIVKAILEEFSQTNCSLFLVIEDLEILKRMAMAGPYSRNISEINYRLDGTGLVAEATRTGKIIHVSDVTTHKEYVPNWPAARSEMSIPLLEGGRVLGVLDIQSTETNAFSPDDERLMGIFAGRAALALAQSLQYESELRRSQRLSDLQNLSAELNSIHTEQELLERLVTGAAKLSSSPVCTVMLMDKKSDEVILAAHSGLPASVPKGLRIPVAQLPESVEQAFKSGRMIIISNIDQDLPDMRKVLVHPDVNAFFAFPLLLDGIVAGAITLSSLQPRKPSEAEIHTYQLLTRLASAALDNVRLFESINRSLQRMGSLRRVDMAISASFDLVMTLNILLEQVTTQLGVDAADILVFDQSDSTLKYTCGRGFHSQALKYTNLRIGEGFAGQAALERRTVHVADLQEVSSTLSSSLSLPSEGFVSYWGVPLVAKGNIQGVLEVFSRKPVQSDPEWINFMETLAGQAAIAIDNVLLFNHLERSNADLSMAYDSTLSGWASALELRDTETEGHTRRVAAITTQLAIRMGVHDEEIMYMRWGSLLHDIGKMGIPDSILLKPGPLTDVEWIVMRTHPGLAYEMLSPIEYLGNALDIPYCHHEKWDGSGYPRALKGEQIPLAARIFAVVDVWDALTSDRPYRSAWTPEKTRDYIQEQISTHFDPQVANAFLEMIGEDGKFSI